MSNSNINTTELKKYIIDVLKQENKYVDENIIELFLFSLKEKDFPVNVDKLVELNVYTYKRNVIRKLQEYNEGKDYCSLESNIKTAGRPSENIMLSVECFKSLCITSKNEFGKKTREYYITIEEAFKKYMEESFNKLKEENEKLNIKLTEEHCARIQTEKDNIKMKKYICTTTLKNHYRHQFPVKPCIYILKNPDEVYDKYKYGLSSNMNERLASDRTMIPNIKVKYILYTEHCELFEKIINIKYKDRLMLPVHEWIYDSIDNIITNIRNINKVCGFDGLEETELWKYNMEEPPKNTINIDTDIQVRPTNNKNETVKDRIIKTTNEPENIEKDIKELSYRTSNLGVLTDRLHRILPGYLSRGDYLKKNNEAPDSERYCNGFCQKYKSLDEFLTINTGHNTICELCKNMEIIAKIKISKGLLTADQIRSNPEYLVLNDNERLCRKCENIKDKNEYEKNRILCKTCRSNDSKSKISNYCEIELKNDVTILYNMRKNKYEMKVKLNDICKDNLIKIIKQLKIGRKSSDTKETMVNNVMNYFETLEFQSLDNFLKIYFNS
jgi:phage anti-repressor protein